MDISRYNWFIRTRNKQYLVMGEDNELDYINNKV